MEHIIQKNLKPINKIASRILSWSLSPKRFRTIGEPFFRLFGRRRNEGKFDLSKVRRVVVIRLDGIGDVVMTSPFLRELRRNLPHAHITLIVQPYAFNVVELCPYVNQVICYAVNASDILFKGRRSLIRQYRRTVLMASKYLWNKHIELGIIPRWNTDQYLATFLIYCSGAYWRVGYSEKVRKKKALLNDSYDALLTHPIVETALQHQVEYNLDIIRFLKGTIQQQHLELWLSDADKAFAETVLKTHHVQKNDNIIAIAPGASAPSRMWPISNFVKLSRWLQRTYNVHIIVMGGPGEETLGQQFGHREIDVIGTTLRQTGALLEYCSLFIGNNSGIKHLASASGVPVVEISEHPLNGSSSYHYAPSFFYPWGVSHIVLQRRKRLHLVEKDASRNKLTVF